MFSLLYEKEVTKQKKEKPMEMMKRMKEEKRLNRWKKKETEQLNEKVLMGKVKRKKVTEMLMG